MKIKKQQEDRFIVSVKVGPKGQITIPMEARRMFDIAPGDTLMVMGDRQRGIALLKDDIFYRMMDGPAGAPGADGQKNDGGKGSDKP